MVERDLWAQRFILCFNDASLVLPLGFKRLELPAIEGIGDRSAHFHEMQMHHNSWLLCFLRLVCPQFLFKF